MWLSGALFHPTAIKILLVCTVSRSVRGLPLPMILSGSDSCPKCPGRLARHLKCLCKSLNLRCLLCYIPKRSMIFSKEYVGYLARHTVKHLIDAKVIRTDKTKVVEERVYNALLEELQLEDR